MKLFVSVCDIKKSKDTKINELAHIDDGCDWLLDMSWFDYSKFNVLSKANYGKVYFITR